MTQATPYPLTYSETKLATVTLAPKPVEKTVPTPATCPADCVAFETPTTQYLGITQYDAVTRHVQVLCLDEQQVFALVKWLHSIGHILGGE